MVRLDRPSSEVCGAVNREQHREGWTRADVPQGNSLEIFDASPVLSGAGQAWARSVAEVHERLLTHSPDAILMLDDDQLFTDDGITEIHGHLEFFCQDRYDFRSLFLWDRITHYNELIPTHITGNLFRAYPDDRYSTKFVAQCPEAVARSGAATLMKYPIANYGWLTQDDRDAAWAASRSAGRIDAHTLALTRPPRLIEFPCPTSTTRPTEKLTLSV